MDNPIDTVYTYDDLVRYITENVDEINKSSIKKIINQLPDEVFRHIYQSDSWILKEDIPVTGDLKRISRKKARELVEKDLLFTEGLVGLDRSGNNRGGKYTDKAA